MEDPVYSVSFNMKGRKFMSVAERLGPIDPNFKAKGTDFIRDKNEALGYALELKNKGLEPIVTMTQYLGPTTPVERRDFSFYEFERFAGTQPDTEKSEKENVLTLEKGKDVIISDSRLLKKSARFEEPSFFLGYSLTFSTQFKPLAFLGEYVSTFVTRGSYMDIDFKRIGWEIKESNADYLRVKKINKL